MPAPPFPPLPLPDGITESYLPSHDLTYHVLSAGDPKNPLILCLHGFPELAFSWRKIIPQIAAEGYHVVAYDRKRYRNTTSLPQLCDVHQRNNTHTFSRTRLRPNNKLGHPPLLHRRPQHLHLHPPSPRRPHPNQRPRPHLRILRAGP